MTPSVRSALVTGATGFIGGRLAAALAEDGWNVRCLVHDRSRAQPLQVLRLTGLDGEMPVFAGLGKP